MPYSFISRFVVAIGIVSLLGGCASWGGTVEDIPQNNAETGGAISGSNDKLLGENGIGLKELINGSDSAANALPVNKYLWRGALDTLSFLPLASTDPFSGVIATEWGASPSTPNERVRVNAYVQGTDLTAQALDVKVFQEKLTASGAWVAAPVNPATAEEIKDAILLSARQLRIKDLDNAKL